MPAQPTWFHRLDKIIAELQLLPNEHLDRQSVEKLFHVRERRARQLMAGLPCLQVGNAVAVDRNSMIERLEKTAKGDRFQWETSRRARVAESLDTIRKHTAARCVRVPTHADSRNRIVRDLAQGIELRPGELRIHFSGAEDLAAKLFDLSQAMANDWTTFSEAVQGPLAQNSDALKASGYQ